MKPMIKTDKCVKVLDNVLGGISPGLFDEIWFDKNKILRGLTRMRALLGYTVCPIVEIKVNSFDDKDALLVWMKEHQLWTGEPYFDEVWNVLQKEVITTTDLEYEFIENCPDLDSIPKSLNITRVKFKEILSNLPNEDVYSLRNLLTGSNNNIYSQRIKELESAGRITASEAKQILEHIGVIISNLHNIARGIAWKYNELKEMAGVKREKEDKSPFTIPTWGAIYYYTTAPIYTAKKGEIIESIPKFIDQYKIDTTYYSFRTEYYKIRSEINNPKKQSVSILKSVIERLSDIIPFVKDNYPEFVEKIENDITLLECELIKKEDGKP